MIKVQPFPIDEQLVIKEEKLQKEEQMMNHAISLNKIARTVFIIILTIFNVGYWTVAYLDYFTPVEHYIKRHRY